MVKLIDISKSYGDNLILNSITYAFKDKGLVLLKGESGSGKTTLLDLIAGRRKLDRGNIICEGEIFYLSNNDLIDEFKVKELIEVHKDLFLKFKQIKTNLSIDSFMNKKVSCLSKGEKQRLGVFLALSSNCEIVLLDEPLAGVDDKYKSLMIKEIKKHSKRKLIIMATHDNVNSEEVFLKDGCLFGNNSNNTYKHRVFKRNLSHPWKWSLILMRKQLFSKVIYFLSLASIVFSSINFKSNINEIKSEFITTFANKSIYYKKSEARLNQTNFYNDVIKQLPYELYDYYYSFYSKEKAEVKILNYYIGNENLFSNIMFADGLKEDEIILQINYQDFCSNNMVSYCYKNQIEEELRGRYLKYDSGDNCVELKVEKVIFGDTSAIFSSSRDELIESLISIHNDYILDYYLLIYQDKIHDFYNKINSHELLLQYGFNKVYEDNDYVYFSVSESDKEHFSFQEVEDNHFTACSNIGVSCSSFNFGTINSLMYIDNISVKEQIKYQKVKRKLDYNEIVVSSELAEKINKTKGDFINIKFYINGSFYVLENVEIIDVFVSNELMVLHSDYDYKLFYEKFNVFIRIDYVYGEEIQGYEKADSLDYQIVDETLKSIQQLFAWIEVFSVVMYMVVIFILVVLEGYKMRKHKQVYGWLRNNHAPRDDLYNSYMLLEFLLGCILIFDFILFVAYIFIFLVFYAYKKKKSRIVTLD